jgi:hypothetical protein
MDRQDYGQVHRLSLFRGWLRQVAASGNKTAHAIITLNVEDTFGLFLYNLKQNFFFDFLIDLS